MRCLFFIRPGSSMLFIHLTGYWSSIILYIINCARLVYPTKTHFPIILLVR